ncbi:helix-turn-helix domain-containing protein [Mycobacteroides abscessus subsp. abscessus]|uniref:helix-turn-helix transcriptional regulator n=1 Tax=Mycobacteroides abscessus TaxID=36809 RepID=UPI0009A58AE9|nr:helix-turn-helix domain-containing protein [Mycobacteroides abscessus]QSM92995.1 helix-turn-helix domain-containing protein [Mycobacteroides abscessus subsp. abscessus]QSM98033.1 helix-turn-helix domain-containing protein [Mycobacteroides abscessus subsp. abscessus]SLI40883.1 Helix-turn-helix domain [Mycobacteroides abscessus subsp. abscessus]
MTVQTSPRVPAPPALRVREAAAYLGVSVAAMRKWREQNTGPKANRAGGTGTLYYPITELDRWMLGADADRKA